MRKPKPHTCENCGKKAEIVHYSIAGKKRGIWIGECCWTLDCLVEIWAVYTACCGNGRALFGLASSRKSANKLGKDFRTKIWGGDDFNPDNFIITIKKVKNLDSVVMDFT